MCGRLDQSTDPSELAARFGAGLTDRVLPPPGSNTPPTARISAIAIGKDGGRKLIQPHWGMIGRDGRMIRHTHNARTDRLLESRLWRPLLERGRRCLIPFDAFYEWEQPTGYGRSKEPSKPYTVRIGGGNRLYAFAGLYSTWRAPVPPQALGEGQEPPIELCAAIITTGPNAVMNRIHDRMPAILDEEDFPAWLGEREATTDELLQLLKPWPEEQTDLLPGAPFQSRPGAGGPRKNASALPPPAESAGQ